MEGDVMKGYYDEVEAQLRTLTERGAHRRPRVRLTPMVAVAASLILVVAVGGVFVGLRGRSHEPAAPPACASPDWRMTGIRARQLDRATVAGISISSAKTCHLRLSVAFDLFNRSGALAGAIGARVDRTVTPGASVARRWVWRNLCGRGSAPSGPYWFHFRAGGRTLQVPVSPPPCVDRHETTGFGRFELTSPTALGPRGIGPVVFGRRFDPTLVALSNLLGVFGRRSAGPGCGVDRVEQLLDGITLFFGRGRLVGYEYRGRFLATKAGLRVGNRVARARRLYGRAFKVSAAQGGSWSADGLIGYLSAPKGGRIMSIDSGNVGCPALTP
jgi:hypothetical protein